MITFTGRGLERTIRTFASKSQSFLLFFSGLVNKCVLFLPPCVVFLWLLTPDNRAQSVLLITEHGLHSIKMFRSSSLLSNAD